MSTRRRRKEAAAWFARMNRPGVPASELQAFSAWRGRPGAQAAFDAVRRAWTRSDILRGLPAAHALTVEALSRAPGHRRPRRKLLILVAGVGGVAGAVCAGVALLALGGPSWSTPPERGETIVLADGSRVRLDADTRLRSRWLFGARHVSLLRGEALFEVVHDPARPFIVDAGPSTVIARGTRFDVLRLPSVTRVTLVRGRVEVRDRSGAPNDRELAPGQATRTGARTPVRTDVSADLGWTRGQLVFDHTPAAEAVALMSRHSATPLRLTPSSSTDLVISGVFATTDTAGFVAALASLGDAQVERAPDGATEIRLKRSQGAS